MTKINIDTSLFNHPKIKRLRTYCGPQAEIYIIRLWAYAADFHPQDGKFKGYEASEIEGLVGWMGPSGDFLSALKKLGLVDIDKENSVTIHDWLIHAGHVYRYHRHGQVMSRKRWRSRTKLRNATSIATSIATSNAMECNGMELNKTPPISPKGGGWKMEGFKLFWNTYPRKVGKGAAEKAWFKINFEAVKVNQVLVAVDRHKQSRDWMREGGQFIPHPATWLNQRRWEDESSRAGATGPSSFFDKIVGRENEPVRKKPQMGGLPEL